MSFDFYNTSAQLCVVGELYGLIGHFVLYLEGFVTGAEKSNRITMLFTIECRGGTAMHCYAMRCC